MVRIAEEAAKVKEEAEKVAREEEAAIVEAEAARVEKEAADKAAADAEAKAKATAEALVEAERKEVEAAAVAKAAADKAEADAKYKEVEVYETTVPSFPENEDALAQIIEEANGRPFVLDFQFDACRPCQNIAEEFETLMDTYDNVLFFKVDVYNIVHRPMLISLGISSTPTFKVYNEGLLINTIEGES